MSFSVDSLNRKLSKLGIRLVKGKADTSHLIKVRLKKGPEREAYSWCENRFMDEWVWSNPTNTDWFEIYFRHKEDALAFSLTFSSHLVT